MSRWRWRLYLTIAFVGPLLCLASGVTYLYVSSARLIEQRMRFAFEREPAQVLARPMRLQPGQVLSHDALVRRLNALGYSERAQVTAGGEFATDDGEVVVQPRSVDAPRDPVRVTFGVIEEPAILRGRARITRLDGPAGPVEAVMLERPIVSGLTTASRQKQRKVALAHMPPRVIEAVLAIEDRRFYLHPGVDVIRTAGALVTNLIGSRPYLVGGSTLTQQLVKNFFLSPEKTIQRKLLEQTMALILEQRLTKDEILELYLNEVYLGQRGSFAIHGVAEAAQLFFGKSVANLSLAEAATIAGVIQSPAVHSPLRSLERARARRAVVLHAMARAGFISEDDALRVAREPLDIAAQTLEAEAPYFVDLVGDEVERLRPDLGSSQSVSILSTLDLHLQDLAQAAISRGLETVDARRGDTRAEAALVALDPRSGDVLALVGGRSYRHSQFNRAVRARRQPGSVFKPFVFLTAFERAVATGRRDLTPSTLVIDAPTGFVHGGRTWRPSNYRNEYDGVITWRRALALSRNVATVKVAELTGYQPIANLWGLFESGAVPEAYPAIALGVFETTPLEIASAYTVFASGGTAWSPHTVEALRHDGEDLPVARNHPAGRAIARPDTTYLVTDMMRSVLSGGTGARARTLGFGRDAAAKSGTTNDLRDAWFVGFTPELLTVVWVGCDDNTPVGLSGTEAALPIWTEFMAAALAGHPDTRFAVPPGVNLVQVDPDTGQLAGPYCPRRRQEAFLTGTGPTHRCTRHLL